jgi:hypothetical protein
MAEQNTTNMQDDGTKGKGGKKIPAYLKDSIKNYITECHLEGMSMQSTADAVDVKYGIKLSKMTISTYMKGIKKEWLADRVEDINELRLTEVKKLLKVESEFWREWKRSKEPKKRTTSKRKGTGSPLQVVSPEGEITTETGVTLSGVETQEQETESLGDPRYLMGVQWCIQMRCKILGVEAPTVIAGGVTIDMRKPINVQLHHRKRPENFDS